MKKIRAAVVGYGNIGHYALQALEAAPDFEVAGIVRRNGAENKPEELARYDVVKDIRELQDVRRSHSGYPDPQRGEVRQRNSCTRHQYSGQFRHPPPNHFPSPLARRKRKSGKSRIRHLRRVGSG